MKLFIHLLIIVFCFSFLLASGCSKDISSKDIHTINKHTKQKRQKKYSKADGEIISMKKIKVPGMDPSIQAYRMMYWSSGTKTEAYIAVPKGPGTYSLFVNCHGGWTIPTGSSHLTEINGEYETVHLTAQGLIGNAANYLITIAPMYRGYGNSNGTVHGIYENTVDTENAIKAITDYFKSKKETRHLQDLIYLNGVSMGGGVALKVATERQDVRSVVAISPFVGWNLFDNWEQKNENNERWTSFYNASVEAYGHFDPKKPIYIKQSIQYDKIKAPTIIIHGTDDKTLPWQTAQLLYDIMKANHQDVTLKLVQGGNHGLTNKGDVLRGILNEWYSKHY